MLLRLRLIVLLIFVAFLCSCGGDKSGIKDGTGWPGDYSGYDAGPKIPCQFAVDCPPEMPFCDQEEKLCIACLNNEDCGYGSVCIDGICFCPKGSSFCVGDELFECDPGPAYTKTLCDNGCLNDACAQCVPGQTYCEGTRVVECAENGKDTKEIEICSFACDDGACTPCFPGEKQCSDDNVEICSENGTEFVFERDCSKEPGGKVCLKGNCIDPCSSDFKFFSNIGCEYWAVDLDQASGTGWDGANAQFAIVVSNVSQQTPANVVVKKEGEEIASAFVEPEGVHVFELEPYNVDGTMKALRAYQVTSDEPIIAYQFNPLANEGVFSNDASLLLALNSLGTRYRILGWPDQSQYKHGYITLVGTRADTEVTIYLTAQNAAGDGIEKMPPGSVYKTTLQPFEVLNLQTWGTGQDFSGTLIESTQRIAVFSGHEAAFVPLTSPCVNGQCLHLPGQTCDNELDCRGPCCADHLEQQLYPEDSWGKTYIAARTRPRGNEGEVWRIVASQDDTQVTLDPNLMDVPVLQNGQVFEIHTKDSFVVNSNKPVLLGQFMVGQNAPLPRSGGTCSVTNDIGICFPSGLPCDSCLGCQEGDVCQTHTISACSLWPDQPCGEDANCTYITEPDDSGTGDPAFILSVPVEQLRDDYVFLVPDNFDNDFVTVYAKSGVSITLDGVSQDNKTWVDIADGWRMVHLSVEDGVHRLHGTDTFGAVVHGYDCFVSYGYPAGMNISTLVVPNP